MKSLFLLCFLCFSAAAFSQMNKAAVKRPSGDSLSRVAHAAMDKQYVKDSAERNRVMAELRKRRTDSLSQVLQSDMKLTRQKADAVLNIINESVKAMDDNARNRDVKGEEKINRFKAIAKDRDEKIAALLSTSEVEQLKDIIVRTRQKDGRL
jgi:hypothetical protein